MKVLGFTGYAQSGKDAAAGFLVERGFKKLSFAEPLRKAVYALNPIIGIDFIDDHFVRVQEILDAVGYETAKREYPEYRELLQRFGTDVGRTLFGEDFWVDRVTDQLDPAFDYVIPDVRFQNEALAVRRFHGKVWRITRPGVGAINTHISDTGIDSLVVDGVIPNTGTLEHYKKLVLEVAGLA